MANWYCRPDATSDANAGTGPGTTVAVQNIDTAYNKASAGDTVYCAPGVYRKVLSFTAAGSSGSPITVIGNIDGTIFGTAPGRIRNTNYTVNDTTAPTLTTVPCTIGAAVAYAVFQNIKFYWASNLSLFTCSTGCHDLTFTDCFFNYIQTNPSANAFLYTSPGTAGAAANLLFDRIRFLYVSAVGGTSHAFQFTLPSSTGGVDFNANIVIRNSLLLSIAGVALYVQPSGANSNKGGGVTLQNSTVVAGNA